MLFLKLFGKSYFNFYCCHPFPVSQHAAYIHQTTLLLECWTEMSQAGSSLWVVAGAGTGQEGQPPLPPFQVSAWGWCPSCSPLIKLLVSCPAVLQSPDYFNVALYLLQPRRQRTLLVAHCSLAQPLAATFPLQVHV